jgi:hypothetical protein
MLPGFVLPDLGAGQQANADPNQPESSHSFVHVFSPNHQLMKRK